MLQFMWKHFIMLYPVLQVPHLEWL